MSGAERLAEEVDRLRDEIELLNTAAMEDARDIREYKTQAEEARMHLSHALQKHKEDERYIETLKAEVQNLSRLRFESQTQVKSLNNTAEALREAAEERDLLARQADEDTARIRRLQHDLDLVTHERNRLEKELGEAVIRRDEALEEAETLREHAAELRQSNATLAQRQVELQEQLAGIEAETVGQWFVRTGRKDVQRAHEQREQLAHEASSGSAQTSPSHHRNAGRVTSPSAAPNDDEGAADGTPAMTATGGSTFSTVRALRRGRGQAGAGDDDGRSPQRPSTAPLDVEAIYGEKAGTDGRMYLVKYTGVASEHWMDADQVAECVALQRWRESKARDRQYVAP